MNVYHKFVAEGSSSPYMNVKLNDPMIAQFHQTWGRLSNLKRVLVIVWTLGISGNLDGADPKHDGTKLIFASNGLPDV